MNVKKILSLSLGLLILGTAAILLGTGTVAATPRLHSVAAAPPTPSIPVVVTNTPLPVSISGTPTVNANIGTPNVNINGTPNVNANITTSATAPLYVDTDRPARNGFNASCGTPPINLTTGQAQCQLYTVPEASIVVIETVACSATVSAGQGVPTVEMIVPKDGVQFYYPLAMTNQTNNNTGVGLDVWANTSPIRVYANSPQGGTNSVFLFFDVAATSLSTPDASIQSVSCSISGHVVQP